MPGLAEPISHFTDAVRPATCSSSRASSPSTATATSSAPTTSSSRRARCSQTSPRVLAAAGATFADVVKVNVYLTDIADRPRINPVRQEIFGDVRPASTLVEVSALAVPGAKIEIEAVALLA